MRTLQKPAFISITVLAFITLLVFGAPPAVAEKGAAPDAYEFPVRPGTAAWGALQSHDEMLQVTQVPDLILAKMSTPGLLETVLDYPLFGDLLAYNSPQRGFDAVRSQFNGLRELIDRPEAGLVLLGRYREMDPVAIGEDWSLVDEGNYTLEFLFVEMLLAQDQVLAGLSDGALDELLFETLVKKEQKLERFDIYGADGLERTALVAARLLQYAEEDFAKEAGEDLAAFLREGWFGNAELLDRIFARAEVVLFGEAVSPSWSWRDADPSKDYGSTVYTPKGSAVSVIVTTYELTSSQIASYNQWVADNYPSATRETNSSRRYNCHSYAWYSQSTSNIRWMNTPGDDTYWLDGSYIPFYTIPNTRVSYVYGDHSAIAISSSEYRSKWGQLPRMRHSPTYCPYNSSTRYSYLANY